VIAEDCLKHCPKVRSVWELYIALLHRVLLHIVLYIALLHIVLSAGGRGTTLGTIILFTLYRMYGLRTCARGTCVLACIARCMDLCGHWSVHAPSPLLLRVSHAWLCEHPL